MKVANLGFTGTWNHKIGPKNKTRFYKDLEPRVQQMVIKNQLKDQKQRPKTRTTTSNYCSSLIIFTTSLMAPTVFWIMSTEEIPVPTIALATFFLELYLVLLLDPLVDMISSLFFFPKIAASAQRLEVTCSILFPLSLIKR